MLDSQRRNSVPTQRVGGREKVKLCMKDGKEGGKKEPRLVLRTTHSPTQQLFTEILLHVRHWAHLRGARGYRLNE